MDAELTGLSVLYVFSKSNLSASKSWRKHRSHDLSQWSHDLSQWSHDLRKWSHDLSQWSHDEKVITWLEPVITWQACGHMTQASGHMTQARSTLTFAEKSLQAVMTMLWSCEACKSAINPLCSRTECRRLSLWMIDQTLRDVDLWCIHKRLSRY